MGLGWTAQRYSPPEVTPLQRIVPNIEPVARPLAAMKFTRAEAALLGADAERGAARRALLLVAKSRTQRS